MKTFVAKYLTYKRCNRLELINGEERKEKNNDSVS